MDTGEIILGTLLGILSTLAGISFQTRLSWRHDRKTRKLEKLEELLSLADECVFASIKSPCDREELTAGAWHRLPEIRMRVLTCLYLPELAELATTLTTLTSLAMADHLQSYRADAASASKHVELPRTSHRQEQILSAKHDLDVAAEALCRKIAAS